MSAPISEFPAPESSNTGRRIKFDQNSSVLAGEIVDWCKSLSNTNIKEIRLHRTSQPLSFSDATFFVVLVLEDGSSYRIRRQIPHSLATNSEDTIERILPNELFSQRLITVTFAFGHYTSLMFVLTVCKGIQCLRSTKTAFYKEESFAYALLSNVTRNSLRPKDMSNPHETRLESLWKDAYQFVHSREGGFREETLADQTQAMVQRMLRAAAKERVASFLGRNECSNCTAAGMAWTEVSARTNEASRLSQWDQAWDYRWHQAWMRRWAEHWRNESSSQDTSMRLKFLSNLETFESGPKIDGSVSGRAAGRVLVKAQAAATAGTTCRSHPEVSPQFCESPIEAPKGRHLETTNSQVGPVSDMSHRIGTMTIEEIELAPQATNITENPSTPSVYQSLARDSDICPIWVGTFEEAFKIGWAAAWEQYFAMGRKVADRLLQDPKQGPGISSTDPASQAGSTLPQTPSELVKRIFKPSSVNKGVVLKDPVPSPATAQLLHTQHPNIQTPTDGSSKVVTSQAGHAQSRLLVDKIRKLLVPQIRRTLQVGSSQIQTIIESQLSREQNKIKQNALASAPKIPLKFKESFARFNLTDRASEAWQHIAKIENSPERKLKSSAASEWDRKAAKPFTPVVLALMGRKSQNQVVGIWEETFRKAWEATWKDYWEAAWQATYKHGWQEAVHKAFESGVDDALKNKHSEEISHSLKWPSYQPVKGFIQEGDTYSDTLDRMHTMCKELNQLHLALQHSIPISHEETMTIEVNQSTMLPPSQPWTKLMEASSSRIVYHFELQQIIEDNSRHWFDGNEDLRGAFIQGMSEIWEFTQRGQTSEPS